MKLNVVWVGAISFLGLARLHAASPTMAGGQPMDGVHVTGQWRHEELRRFKAREAHQGIATDGKFAYVISNHAIGKYRIETGERVGGWEGEKNGPIIHLNAGTVRKGRLYVAHSNYPGVPMVSSVEIWDPKTMQHVGTHSLGLSLHPMPQRPRSRFNPW